VLATNEEAMACWARKSPATPSRTSATFLARLPIPEVSWVDEHLLVIAGGSRRNQAEPDGPASLANQTINPPRGGLPPHAAAIPRSAKPSGISSLLPETVGDAPPSWPTSLHLPSSASP
jgi:hypothetical protein